MPQVLKPEIFEDKDLCLYDKKELLTNAIQLYKQDHLKIYWKPADESRIIEEEYCFLIVKNTLVTVVEFWFQEINNLKFPKIKNSTTLKKHRGLGYATLIYSILFEKFGGLISDVTLNGKTKKPNGSYGLWLNLLKIYKHFIFDDRENKYMKYSKHSAFKSVRNGYRRLVITTEDNFKKFKI